MEKVYIGYMIWYKLYYPGQRCSRKIKTHVIEMQGLLVNG